MSQAVTFGRMAVQHFLAMKGTLKWGIGSKEEISVELRVIGLI